MSRLDVCNGSELWMQAQCIVFRRYPEVLAPFKYAGYPMLLQAVSLPSEEDSTEQSGTNTHFLGPEKAPHLQASAFLASYKRIKGPSGLPRTSPEPALPDV